MDALQLQKEWEKPDLKPWQEVKLIQTALEADAVLMSRLFDQGTTHIRVRRVANSLVINTFRITTDSNEPRYPVHPAAKPGYWFTKTNQYFFHCMPVEGPLPRTGQTVIKHQVF